MVEMVHAIADATTGFASVSVVKQDRNQGLAKSVIGGVTELLTRFESVIVVEDDIVTSPNFLTYMNHCLDHYRDDPSVFSIGGWTFPTSRMQIPPAYPYDTYPAHRSCSWGWGTWRNRWSNIDWSMSYFQHFMTDPQAQKMFNRGGDDLVSMLEMQYQGKLDSWAIRFCYAHYASNACCIHPVKTLVHNIGFDDSGTHCAYDPDQGPSQIDPTWVPKSLCPGNPIDPEIFQLFHRASSPVKRSIPQRLWRKARSIWQRL
jgi:hypothetical protein